MALGHRAPQSSGLKLVHSRGIYVTLGGCRVMTSSSNYGSSCDSIKTCSTASLNSQPLTLNPQPWTLDPKP